MKKVRTLDDLEEMIGRDAVDRCFTEYFMTIMAQAKKYEDLQNRCAVMDEDELRMFIKSIGRTESHGESEDTGSVRQIRAGQNTDAGSGYLEGFCAAMAAQGYERRWVYTIFRCALEKEYER